MESWNPIKTSRNLKVRCKSEYSRMRRGSGSSLLKWLFKWKTSVRYLNAIMVTFMTKCLKFYVHSKNAIKYWQKVFGS